MNLLLVHGRAQENKSPRVLQTAWMKALAEGLERAQQPPLEGIRVEVPYYGNELRKLVDKLSEPITSEVAARGVAENDTKGLAFRYEVYAELAAAYGLSDQEIRAHAGDGPQERGALNQKWVLALLRALDARTDLGKEAIERFTQDVFAYLTVGAVAKTVDGIIGAVLKPGRWVVVAHSLGTIVAYNVLREIATKKQIDVVRFITVGSPLGIRAVRDRLKAPITMPNCVREWYNAYDPRDVVALYPLDAHNFSIDPPIENCGTVDNYTDNRHGIAGYLSDVNVALRIAEVLR